ncbi:putative RNA exonuclease 4 [Podospora australis]|uniref:RNA exonuclease 4 n=1 Tax=Podospora australis TaxID=1536484 RepID=A0AAN6WPW0_9PEZI|nr:putative RNA exonuclease 4 [Podospora australis]
MAPELSQNWKILQARLKAASASSTPTTASKPAPAPSTSKSGKKRKADADESVSAPNKKQKPATSKPVKPAVAPKKKMGAATSQLSKGTSKTIAPNLQLLQQKHDISSEALAEAYNLSSNPALLSSLPSVPNQGLAPENVVSKLGKYLAIDCEMVGIGPGGQESALARVSLVDFTNAQIYDSYVLPQEKVTDWRTHVSGISPAKMRLARPFAEVQGTVAGLLKGRVLVGHDVKHDLQCLELDHPAKMIRDTAKFSGFKKYGNGPKPALRVLAKEILQLENFQGGQHSSIEDARVAMLLFRKYKPAFDVEHANRFPEDNLLKQKGKGGGKGKKGRRR